MISSGGVSLQDSAIIEDTVKRVVKGVLASGARKSLFTREPIRQYHSTL